MPWWMFGLLQILRSKICKIISVTHICSVLTLKQYNTLNYITIILVTKAFIMDYAKSAESQL